MSDIAANTFGEAVYFDGRLSTRRSVRVVLASSALQIEDGAGSLIEDWPYDQIESLNAPENVLRLGRRHNVRLERLEITDDALAAAIDSHALQLDRSGRLHKRQQLAVMIWSLLATASLVIIAWMGVPALATRVTPYVPVAVERRIGTAVDAQIRATLDTRHAGAAFECAPGSSDKPPARAALVKLVGKLENAASLAVPLSVTVVHRPESNAFAIPGGHIFVFEGLIDQSSTPDELAGVLAHEIGHVAHRDGTRAVLQQAGLSFLFGMLLGDFVGGGAVIVAARTVLQSSYSREQEAAADAYGVALMSKAGGDPRALGTLLGKIGGATEPGMKILRDHPDTKARMAAIDRLAPSGAPAAPFISNEDWAALRGICKG
jgi:Zn-dependent protease with chaperone function